MGEFTCQHLDITPGPRNMGRGQARVRRLAAWYGRPCPRCAMSAAIAHVATPTTYHIEETGVGGTYGHPTTCCDEAGCGAGSRRYLGTVLGAEAGKVYEIEGKIIVAEVEFE